MNKSKKRGFTLFIAVITASIVLAMGLSILNITLKEYILSGIARESEMAFYAADAGMECALYWDFSNEASEGGGQGAFDMSANPRTIACMGSTVKNVGGSGNALVGGTNSGEANEFQVEWGTPKLCAHVEVTKNTGGSCPSGLVCTDIESRGYNRDCDSLDDPRIVERAMHSEY